MFGGSWACLPYQWQNPQPVPLLMNECRELRCPGCTDCGLDWPRLSAGSLFSLSSSDLCNSAQNCKKVKQIRMTYIIYETWLLKQNRFVKVQVCLCLFHICLCVFIIMNYCLPMHILCIMSCHPDILLRPLQTFPSPGLHPSKTEK